MLMLSSSDFDPKRTQAAKQRDRRLRRESGFSGDSGQLSRTRISM